MSLLLIAHGSPDPRHAAAMAGLAERVSTVTDGRPVSVAFLEHNEPLAADVLVQRSPASPEPVAVVGLLLSNGYHVRVDVRRLLAQAEHPVSDCGPLGLSGWLFAPLDRTVAANTTSADPVGVALVAAGSSRAQAREEVITFAAAWQRHRQAPVRAAFASGDGPTPDEALRMLADHGCADQVVVPLMLAPGVLADRVSEVGAEHGVRTAAPILVDAASSDSASVPVEIVTRILELAGQRNQA